MKKIIFVLIALAPIFLMAQRKPKIKGSRVVTEVREDLPAFNAVELNDNLNIILKKSFTEGYEITADDNLIDVLKFKVEDSTLLISSFYNITAKKKLEIIINFKNLEAITQRDGKIEMQGILLTDKLFINTFGSSKLNVKASASYATLNMENSSKGDFNFDIDSLAVTLKNKADAKIYGSTSVNTIDMYNTTALDIEGSTDSLNLKMYKNAKFVGQKLQAATVRAELKESVTARINAFEAIELISNGNSKTYLYGDPQITILEFLDTSQLLKKKN